MVDSLDLEWVESMVELMAIYLVASLEYMTAAWKASGVAVVMVDLRVADWVAVLVARKGAVMAVVMAVLMVVLMVERLDRNQSPEPMDRIILVLRRKSLQAFLTAHFLASSVKKVTAKKKN